ncbi:helix-turn-helix domain-containing protein [Paenibacillus nasutitermitis]|uniref:HTH-type transcriptional regulator YtdP n=1 Tax=Paenibacillus nasutitermitis TaxID=1652958 RepID=A0A916ZC01_9BACL|nr:helix-turn-helix domain-containing protein [Paenibacillus nasutitermitis]GGD84690.1 putative HTH-type transcriptional regulator YtdP [Paenibacillus nasutitermitis]
MNRSWFYRMLFSYIPVFFIVTAFLFFIFIQTLNRQNRMETEKANDFIAQQALILMDSSLKSIDEKTTFEIMRNPSLKGFFSTSPSTDLYSEVQVMNAIHDLSITNPLISSVYLVRFNDEMVLSQSTSYNLKQFMDHSFIQSNRSIRNSVWTDRRGFREFPSEKEASVVTLIRRYPVFAQDKGMIVINVKIDALKAMISRLYNPKITFMMVTDRQGVSLLDDQGEAADGKAEVLARYQSDYTGWKYETGINQGGAAGFIMSLYNIWFTLGILAVIGAIAWMIYITRKNYRPIELIVSRLQLVASHRLSTDKGHRNEFAFIDSALENMIQQSHNLERQFAEDLSVKKKYFLYELLEGTRQVRLDEWAAQVEKFGISPLFGVQAVFIIEIDKYDQFAKAYSPRDQDIFKFVLSNVIHETVGLDSGSIWNLWTASNQLTGIVNFQQAEIDGASVPVSTFEKIRSWVAENLNFTVTIGVGDVVEHPDNLRDSYKEALEALQFKTVHGANRTIYHNQLQSKGNLHDHMQVVQSISSLYLSQGEWSSQLSDLFRAVAESHLPKADIINLLNSLLFYLNRNISAMGTEYQDLWKAEVMPGLHEGLQSFETLEEIQTLWSGRLEQFALRIETLRESSSQHHLVKEVRAYLENHFHNPDLSLDFLSHTFGMNGKYLSKLFKEEFGVKFVDFLIDLRIRHARQLLTETSHSVQEIAEKVGYTSSISFIRSFKKLTGMPPGDYRKEK